MVGSTQLCGHTNFMLGDIMLGQLIPKRSDLGVKNQNSDFGTTVKPSKHYFQLITIIATHNNNCNTLKYVRHITILPTPYNTSDTLQYFRHITILQTYYNNSDLRDIKIFVTLPSKMKQFLVTFLQFLTLLVQR